MALLSTYAVITRIFGQPIFVDEFVGLILYLPTVLLLAAVLYDRMKNRTRATEGSQPAGHKAA